MKYLKILLLGMVVIGMFAAPAGATVTLKNRDGAAFGSGTNTDTSYRISSQVYSNSVGISTISDDLTSRGLIEVTLTHDVLQGATVNVLITNPETAEFNSAGAGYVFALCDPSANGNGCNPGPTAIGGIVAAIPPSGVTQPNIPLGVTATITAPKTLWLIQYKDNGLGGGVVGDNQLNGTEGNSILRGVALYVKPGLVPAADYVCSNKPIIKIGMTTPGGSTGPVNFAYITPQFSVSFSAGPSTLSAELDTDNDFFTFIEDSGVNVYNEAYIKVEGFVSVTNNGTDPYWWITSIASMPPGTITFDLTSLSEESNINYVKFGFEDCTTSNDKVFHCSKSYSADGSIIGDHTLRIKVDGDTSLNPTLWKLSNFSFPGFCFSNPSGSMGVWYGGLEVLVPFVKGIPLGGYSTVIKLCNRYNKDASMYVSTFADVVGGTDAPIMISTQQLASPLDKIKAGQCIAITDQDIQAYLASIVPAVSNPADVIAMGIPVKFNIRVPAQTGTTTYSGTAGGTISLPNYTGTNTGTMVHQNPLDPFIEGVVISNYPNGGQRAIALKFKSFKNGEYNF